MFTYDNEKPQHKVYINPFRINKQYVTNNDYKKFIAQKGYQKPQYWLSKGWEWVNSNQISCPLYWNYNNKGTIKEFTLHGLYSLIGDAPVCHISYYEASAYAKWANSRLPTEEESEIFLKTMNSKNKNLNMSKSIKFRYFLFLFTLF